MVGLLAGLILADGRSGLADNPRLLWIGFGFTTLGCLAGSAGALGLLLGIGQTNGANPIHQKNRKRYSRRSVETPIARKAASRTHAGNAPRLHFT